MSRPLAATAAVVTLLAVGVPLVSGERSAPTASSRAGSVAPDSAGDPVPSAATTGPEASSGPSNGSSGGSSGRDDVRPTAPLDPTRRSTGEASSLWVVVNKARTIRPLDYRPETGTVEGYQVARPLVGPLTRLLADSDRRGLGLAIASAFRSYDRQRDVHAAAIAELGQEAAERTSARPGHSEHQTGLAVDVVTTSTPSCDFEACFGGTPAGRWVARNAWRYGFAVRYRAGDTAVTGYSPEPWHLRYVGKPLATELRRTGVRTLEEFFDVRGGDYADGSSG